MTMRRDKPKSEWKGYEWQEWVNEATDMHRLALQNPASMNMELWRAEHDRRKAEHAEYLAKQP
jgi:hypothetical protein